MNEDDSEHDEAETRTTTGGDAFRNDLLAAWLDDLEAGRERSVAEYQAMFPGHEEQVAAELLALTSDSDTEDSPLGANAPRIPEVELLEKIGSGGQGVVYRGRQSYVEREVAVKVLAPSTWSDSFSSRFQREAKTLASLRHPNIVACYQAGTTDVGLGYMVMEYIDGPNLREWLAENGPMPRDTALRLCRDLALALDHALEAGIIHRDVKPENVLLRRLPKPADAEFPFDVKLADLGLARSTARLLGEDALTQLTPVGAVMGSPRTMAPEQFDDPDGVDHRADIYGLGCVLFHALSGQPAFQASTLTGAIKEKVSDDLPDVRDAVRDLHPGVAALVRSMMAPNAEDRPRSHAEVASACEAWIGVEARQRRKFARFSVAVVLLILVSLAVVDPWGMVHAPSVVIDTTDNVFEGQAVTLTAKIAGSVEGDYSYAWTQTGVGPRIRLSGIDKATASFVAPRGLGSTILTFGVTASNRWRTGIATVRVDLREDAALAPLPPGEPVPLLRRQRDEALDDWSPLTDTGQWQGAADHLGANGWCKAFTSRSRHLPRGSWVLSGAIEPIKAYDTKKKLWKKLEQAGLRLEFSCGNSIVLSVLNAEGEAYNAGLRREQTDDNGSPIRSEIGPKSRGTWSEATPLQFTITWHGSTLEAAWGTEPGAADWTVQKIAPRSWPSPYPPSTLTLFIDRGHACFCRLTLEGR